MRLPTSLSRLPPSLLLLAFSAIFVRADDVPAEDATSELKIEVTKAVECTRHTQKGDAISVHYRGTLQSDGTEFDASYNRRRPFNFKLGAHMVIAGWDEGLLDMCIGEARRLTIPPEMGYGHRNMGPIPADSVLVFETELMGIDGVEAETLTPTPTPTPTSSVLSTSVDSSPPSSTVPAEEEVVPVETPSQASAIATAVSTTLANPQGSSKTAQEDSEAQGGECRLLGPFALIVQAALGAIALLSLVFKRWRERPRRPMKVFLFDASKQVFGSILLHVLNLIMSMVSSGDLDAATQVKQIAEAAADQNGQQPNPCSFYLLNLAIDTTIGIPVLVVLLRVFHALFLHTYLANPPESIKSGNYGHPPKPTWWMKQSLIYFLGLIGMKLFVFFLFSALPWIAWVGDWALRWTEGNEALQIAFVMFIFPVAMNALQYYIIDSFIKDKSGAGDDGQGGFERVPSHETDGDEEERAGLAGESPDEEDDDSEEEDAKKRDELEVEDRDVGEGSSKGASPVDAASLQKEDEARS